MRSQPVTCEPCWIGAMLKPAVREWAPRSRGAAREAEGVGIGRLCRVWASLVCVGIGRVDWSPLLRGGGLSSLMRQFNYVVFTACNYKARSLSRASIGLSYNFRPVFLRGCIIEVLPELCLSVVSYIQGAYEFLNLLSQKRRSIINDDILMQCRKMERLIKKGE